MNTKRVRSLSQKDGKKTTSTPFGVDGNTLDQKLDDLREPRLHFHNPIFKQLLRVPAEQVVERAISTFSTLNLMAALMLTGITVIAIAPIDVSSVSDDKRILANVFNILATILMNMSVVNVMFTTYILLSLSSEMPSTIYAFLCKADGPTFINFIGTWITCLLYLVLGVLALWIRSDAWAAITITLFSGVFFIAAQLHYGKMESNLFPLGHSGWGSLSLGAFWTESVKQRAKAMGQLCAAEALGHLVQHDGGAQTDFLTGETCGRFAAVLPGLVRVLSQALPDEDESRLRELAEQMARQGLSADTLRRTAAQDARLLFTVRHPRYLFASPAKYIYIFIYLYIYIYKYLFASPGEASQISYLHLQRNIFFRFHRQTASMLADSLRFITMASRQVLGGGDGQGGAGAGRAPFELRLGERLAIINTLAHQSAVESADM